jgi:hypothetical protein
MTRNVASKRQTTLGPNMPRGCQGQKLGGGVQHHAMWRRLNTLLIRLGSAMPSCVQVLMDLYAR